jgi:uncharacterized protein YeaO (DUF488 family)
MFGPGTVRGLLILGFVAGVWPGAAWAQGWPSGGPGGGRWNDPTEQWDRDLAQASGFLIVNGEDVPLPCRMVIEGDDLKINDRVVTSQLAGGNAGGRSNKAGREGKGASRAAAPYARFAALGLGQTIVQNLAGGHLVVALADQPLLILADSQCQREILRTLTQSDAARMMPASLSQRLPPGADAASFDAWIKSFSPSGDFQQRAQAKVDQYDRSEANAKAEIAATRRLNTFSYPLSVLGMVVTTLGIGHLLSHRPPVDAKALETDASPLAIRVLTYSLLLVIIYSAIDLTWTILAHQAGEMIELNPIDNPLQLIAFKGAATGLAVGLLFFLRKYRKAQLAAWWVCLICTLLTARWLTVSHMFAA